MNKNLTLMCLVCLELDIFPFVSQSGTLVVLVHNFLLNSTPLGNQEGFRSKCLWDCTIFPNELVFSGNLTLYFLLSWKSCHITFFKSYYSPCVALIVVIYRVGCIHPTLDHIQLICREVHSQSNCAFKVLEALPQLESVFFVWLFYPCS